MNLSEALDAALPEIPKARLTRVRPPRLDPELIIREDIVDGAPIVGAYQRSQGNFFRFPPLQWQLATMFDGERSYEEIAALFTEQTGAAVGAEDVRTFAQNMDEAEFWYKTPQEKNIALNEKLAAQRARRVKQKSKVNFAHISFTGWDPNRYFSWLDDWAGEAIYSSWSVWAAILLFCFEALVFVSKWHVIGPDIPLFYNFAKKSFFDLAVFWLLFLVIGFFHESAHGLTCKHFGGEVHKMGLMLIYLTPAFFVDITEIWISATKLQRLATIIAGIWVEMIFCGIAMIVWTNTQPGQALHDFSYEVILITGLAVIVVNLNPLIKLDGYYFLTESIGVPDLKERSTAFLSGWFQSRVLGLPVDIPVVSRKQVPFFALYAFVSASYGYLLLFVVIRFTYNVASHWLAEFALIPAGALAFTVFRSRLNSLGDVASRFWKKNEGLKFLLRPVSLTGMAVLVVLFFAPILRDQENALFVVEASHSDTLRAATLGRVEAVFVREGEHVRAGQPLLQLRSAAVDSMHAAAAAQADAARFKTFDAEIHQQSVGAGGVNSEAAARSANLADTAQALLVLRAPADSIVLSDDPEALLNQNVSAGQALITLADAELRTARVFVPVVGLERVPANAEVTLSPPGDFSVVHLTLPALQGDAVTLPAGLVAAQDYKGITLPTYYYARLPLAGPAAALPIGMSGEAKIFGARRSLFQRTAMTVMNLFRAHVW
jgi:putative peptide zinc metalloprotease protein